MDEQGNVVEKGEAVNGKGDWWEYVPTAEGKVDRPVRLIEIAAPLPTNAETYGHPSMGLTLGTVFHIDLRP